jgi:hypothetical protein
VTAILILSACGSASRVTTPTVSVDAIFTSAAQTFAAQMATQVALTPPSATAAPTATPTLPPPPAPIATISFDNPTSSAGDAGGTSTCDNSAYVADVTIPDNTRLDPGKVFIKTWLMQNTGTCPWTPGYKITFVDGEPMNGADNLINMPVPVGNQVKVSVSLVAPGEAGDFYGRWQLKNESGQKFGSIVSVVIKVGESFTPTP